MSVKQQFITERQGKSFVLYAGLLDAAHDEGLESIETEVLQLPSAENGGTAVCLARVKTRRGTFTGIGDADDGNVTRMIIPHKIRMAETRAKARALRDAINVGMAALEELGEDDSSSTTAPPRPTAAAPAPASPDLQKLSIFWARLVAEATPLGIDIGSLPTGSREAISARIKAAEAAIAQARAANGRG